MLLITGFAGRSGRRMRYGISYRIQTNDTAAGRLVSQSSTVRIRLCFFALVYSQHYRNSYLAESESA